MRKYILFSDLDGSLLDDNQIIDKNIYSKVENFIQNNIFIINTGRSFPLVQPVLKQLPKLKYVSCLNGTLIYDLEKNKPLHEEFIGEQQQHLIQNFQVNYPNCLWIQFHQTGIYYFGDRKLNLKYVDDYYPDLISTPQKVTPFSYKWLILSDNSESISKIRTELLEIDGNINCFRSGTISLEINPTNINKAFSVNYFKNHFNEYTTVAFGDHENDLAMLEAADFSYVPSNGIDSLKAKFITLTKSNNQQAINEVIDLIEKTND